MLRRWNLFPGSDILLWRTMKDRDMTMEERKRFAGTNLVREVSYVHEDEARALDERAKKERTSQVRDHPAGVAGVSGIED
jgi:hypothetical protein